MSNKKNVMDEQQFRNKVWLMQGDAIDFSPSQYKGEDQPIIVACARDSLIFAVERASDLYDDVHPAECPLCRERRLHQQRMDAIRRREALRVADAKELLNLI